ncbi:MAG: TetR/AcrR family transcriptional regulator [Leptolyngbya sp. SIO1E4]|nr:TetR/AcrR family transcriptional regulator [Leptolyngbya sp. SIO1E4]
MPWEKTFEIQDAVDKAMHVFWAKGYVDTSIADLLEATGLKRSSLYNAFGGKRDLFVKALRKYDRENSRATLSQLEEIEDPHQVIQTLFEGVIQEALSDPDHKGCLLVNTSLELPTHDKEIQTIVKTGLRAVEAFLQRQIELGQARSELPESIDPQATARALIALITGIRVLGRGAFEESALRSIAAQALRLIT